MIDGLQLCVKSKYEIIIYIMKRSFKEKVLKIVAKIPRGKVMSYKEVAKLAGWPKAYRVVGNILSKNFNPEIPCHRVIRSNGKLGGYNRGIENKQKILKGEGVILSLKNINKKTRK